MRIRKVLLGALPAFLLLSTGGVMLLLVAACDSSDATHGSASGGTGGFAGAGGIAASGSGGEPARCGGCSSEPGPCWCGPRPGTQPDGALAQPDGASGACRPVVARVYDPVTDCAGPEQTLTDLCFREIAPDGTTGVSEVVCLVSDDGTRYVAVKGYTECLEGPGWSTADAYGLGEGWTVRGLEGLCLRDLYLNLVNDAGTVIGTDYDTLCEAAIRAVAPDGGGGECGTATGTTDAGERDDGGRDGPG